MEPTVPQKEQIGHQYTMFNQKEQQILFSPCTVSSQLFPQIHILEWQKTQVSLQRSVLANISNRLTVEGRVFLALTDYRFFSTRAFG